METREEEDVYGNKHFRKMCRSESAGVVFAEWPVIRVSGKVSLPGL